MQEIVIHEFENSSFPSIFTRMVGFWYRASLQLCFSSAIKLILQLKEKVSSNKRELREALARHKPQLRALGTVFCLLLNVVQAVHASKTRTVLFITILLTPGLIHTAEKLIFLSVIRKRNGEREITSYCKNTSVQQCTIHQCTVDGMGDVKVSNVSVSCKMRQIMRIRLYVYLY